MDNKIEFFSLAVLILAMHIIAWGLQQPSPSLMDKVAVGLMGIYVLVYYLRMLIIIFGKSK